MSFRSPALTLSPVYEQFENNEYSFLNASNGKILKDANGLPLIKDDRSMQHITLTSAHMFFGILHDRIVDAMVALCPKMNAATRFLRARQLNIMFYQYIFYDDILKIFVGNEVVNSKLHSDFNTFSSSIEPKILSEYACAAARYIHVFIPGNFIYAFSSLIDLTMHPRMHLMMHPNQHTFTRSNLLIFFYVYTQRVCPT